MIGYSVRGMNQKVDRRVKHKWGDGQKEGGKNEGKTK